MIVKIFKSYDSFICSPFDHYLQDTGKEAKFHFTDQNWKAILQKFFAVDDKGLILHSKVSAISFLKENLKKKLVINCFALIIPLLKLFPFQSLFNIMKRGQKSLRKNYCWT